MNDKQQRHLDIIVQQMETAASLDKCHKCGCFQQTTATLARTSVGKAELADLLSDAKSKFIDKQYDCLGCNVCYPAIAANAFAEAFPEESESLDLCPTEMPEERAGWPPLPGDYAVARFSAPVAVVTLNSDDLADQLKKTNPEGMAVVGPMHTENLGIERVIQNTLANPNIRFLIVCGEDTQQAVGHLPGQSLVSLFKYGFDKNMRILEAHGKRPFLKNISPAQVQTFLEQVQLVPLLGETNAKKISDEIHACAGRNPGLFENRTTGTPVEVIESQESEHFAADAAGFFVIYSDSKAKTIIAEHYTVQGVLDCVIKGKAPTSIYMKAIERKLISRLDHAAYLGRELARAEQALITGERFIQDAEHGDNPSESPCGCSSSCSA